MGWPGPMTHRQFMAWQVWLTWRWNSPSRTDYYLMQIACEARRSWVGKPSKVDMKSFKIPFQVAGTTESDTPQKGMPRKPTKEEATAFAQTTWLSRMTLPVRKVSSLEELAALG